MTLALDTATVIDLVRGRPSQVRENYRRAVSEKVPLVDPVLVLHELTVGAHIGGRYEEEMARVEDVIMHMPIVELSASDVAATSTVQLNLRCRGLPIGDIDTLIVGQALSRGWTLVTRNVRHFGRVEGLPITDWSVGPDPLDAAEIARRVAAL